jgi:hypothetical protein
VSATIWQELAHRVADCFDEVTMRELCSRAERLGVDRSDRSGSADRSDGGGEAPRPMYFI